MTDSRQTVHRPLSSGVVNLIEIDRAVTKVSLDAAVEQFSGKSYDNLKSHLADALIAELQPIQERYAEIRTDDGALIRLLSEGAAAARVTADRTLRRVQDAVGLAGMEPLGA